MLYESIEHRAELKLSPHLPNCTMFDFLPGLLSGFFSLIESEISEQASRQVATKETKTQEVRLVFLPTLLLCSSRFLRALQQNRALSRLLYLLIVAKSDLFYEDF